MNSRTDQELLQEYSARRSEAAFAELVRRHVDLVYSAALRMVGDVHLAKDISQGAFTALAQNAAALTAHPVLSGWLHSTTRNIAANAIRTESRRRAREQEAAAMNELLSAETDASWENIAPHLDAALGQLAEADRDALLLRYFEKKSAPEMAKLLGISDEAAQKRVSRAVERLRDLLQNRGVTVGASGLVVLISTHAVLVAPAGMHAAILASAMGGTAAVAAAPKFVAMTTLQKTAVTGALAIAAAVGLYEWHKASAARRELSALQAQHAPLAEQLAQLIRDHEAATRELAALRADRARPDTNLSELMRLRAEITRLRNEARGGALPTNATASIGRIAELKFHRFVRIGAGLSVSPDEDPLPLHTNLISKVGEPYDRVSIDQDVRALYATGLFANVTVSTERPNGDYSITYIVEDKARPVAPGKLISRDQMAFAGYETPEAAMQSFFWAALTANFAAATNSFGPSAQEQFQRPEALANFHRNIALMDNFKGIQVLARKTLSNDKVELKFRVQDIETETAYEQLIKVNGEWKRHQSVGGSDDWDRSGDIQIYAR